MSIPIAYNLVNSLLYPPFLEKEKILELADFTIRHGDVFVVTYPKSGTTWAQRIMSLIIKGGEQERKLHLREVIPMIELVGNYTAMGMSSPRHFKSHSPYHLMAGGEPEKSVAKYIYIARNPKDVAVSLYHYTKHITSYNFTGDWNCFFELFMKGEVEFNLWFDHVLEWWKHKDADNILYLKYEDMKKDLPGAVKTISEFMGYNLDDTLVAKIAEMSTFNSMKKDPLADPDTMLVRENIQLNSNSAPSMRKGVVGDWRNHFSDEQSARLDAEYDKRMAGSGLEFEY